MGENKLYHPPNLMQSAQKSSNPSFQFLLQYALILPDIYLDEYKIKFTFQLNKK